MQQRSTHLFRGLIPWGLAVLTLLMLTLTAPLEAQRRGGRGGGGGRNMARSSVHGSQPRANNTRGRNMNSNRNRNMNSNRNVNVNRNANVNVNRNVNVNHNVYVNNRGYGYDRWGHPVAAAVGVAAAAVAVGTMVAALPKGCTTTRVGNVTYQQCGSTYYQPVYQGSTVQYVVVQAP